MCYLEVADNIAVKAHRRCKNLLLNIHVLELMLKTVSKNMAEIAAVYVKYRLDNSALGAMVEDARQERGSASKLVELSRHHSTKPSLTEHRTTQKCNEGDAKRRTSVLAPSALANKLP